MPFILHRQGRGNASQQNSEMDDSWDTPSEEEEVIYGTTPPYSARHIKRMYGKNQKASQSRSAGRSPNKGNVIGVFVK